MLVADGLEGGLVDEDVPGVGRDVGVPGAGGDAGVARLLHRGREGVGVVGGDGDGVALLLDELLDHLRLQRGLGLRRPVVDQLDVQLLGRLLGPLLGGVEVRDADELGHHADLVRPRSSAALSLRRALLAHPAGREQPTPRRRAVTRPAGTHFIRVAASLSLSLLRPLRPGHAHSSPFLKNSFRNTAARSRTPEHEELPGARDAGQDQAVAQHGDDQDPEHGADVSSPNRRRCSPRRGRRREITSSSSPTPESPRAV